MVDSVGSSASSQALLEAVVALTSAGDVTHVLARIVASACELTEAEYGALGVIGSDGALSDFITHGIDEAARGRIGDIVSDGALRDFITLGIDEAARGRIGELPEGRGILRLLIDHPEPLRLRDLTAHPESYGFPPHHPPMTSFLGVPLRIRGTVFGNLYLTEKSGGRAFTEEDETLVLALAGAAGFVVENARAYALSERQRSWLEAAARLHETLQGPIELDDAIPYVGEGARAAFGALAVGVFAWESGSPVLIASDGQEGDRVADPALLGGEPLAAAFRGEQPDEVALDRSRVVLFMPVRTRLVPMLVLAVVLDARHDATRQPAQERALATSFAEQAALALDRLQALVDREEHAVVADRDRIARDLHDVVIQRLFATGLQLQGVRARAGGADVQDRLDQAVQDLDATIRDIRTTIFELKQHPGGSTSTRQQVQTLVEEYAGVLGFAPGLRFGGPVDTVVDAATRTQLLAALREALSNIARHAKAASVLVSIEAAPREVVLVVEDDGLGLPAERAESGLRNLRQRATDLGGALDLAPRQPQGTALSWRVPLRSPQDGVRLDE